MTIKTILLTPEKAEYIQEHATDYDCIVNEIKPLLAYTTKVTVTGSDENVKKLFEQIGD